MLSKSLRVLPIVKEKEGEVYDAFSDPEQRYRMRYVDLVVNPKVKDVFVKRTRIMQTMREYFNSFGYMEVETPILQPIPEEPTPVLSSRITMLWIFPCICVSPMSCTSRG